MKKIFLFLILMAPLISMYGQTDPTIDKGTGIFYFSARPSFLVNTGFHSEIAYDYVNNVWYRWNRNSPLTIKWERQYFFLQGEDDPSTAGILTGTGPKSYMQTSGGDRGRWWIDRGLSGGWQRYVDEKMLTDAIAAIGTPTTTFIGQSDTPSAFGTAGQLTVVNATGNGLDFIDPVIGTDGAITDVSILGNNVTFTGNNTAFNSSIDFSQFMDFPGFTSLNADYGFTPSAVAISNSYLDLDDVPNGLINNTTTGHFPYWDGNSFENSPLKRVNGNIMELEGLNPMFIMDNTNGSKQWRFHNLSNHLYLNQVGTNGQVIINTAENVTQHQFVTGATSSYNIRSAGNSFIRVTNTTGNVLNQMLVTSTHGIFGTLTQHDLQLFTGNSVKAIVKLDGKFGIGTLSPTHRLEVHSGVQAEIARFRGPTWGGIIKYGAFWDWEIGEVGVNAGHLSLKYIDGNTRVKFSNNKTTFQNSSVQIDNLATGVVKSTNGLLSSGQIDYNTDIANLPASTTSYWIENAFGTGIYNTTHNVGIGLQSARTGLDVYNDDDAQITVQNTTQGSEASPATSGIEFRGSGNVKKVGLYALDESADNSKGSLSIHTGDSGSSISEKMLIDGNGTVLITNTSGGGLHLEGSLTRAINGIVTTGGGLTYNNYNVAGWLLSSATSFNPSGGALTVTGFTAPTDLSELNGFVQTIVNESATDDLILSGQNTGSLPANRMQHTGNITIPAGRFLEIKYIESISKWVVAL